MSNDLSPGRSRRPERIAPTRFPDELTGVGWSRGVVLGLQRPLVLGYSDGGQSVLELGMRYPGLARAVVSGGTQARLSEAYLEAARALLSITDSGEADPDKLEREQPDWLAYLREAHGHVYDLEYWRTYVKQITSL